MKKYLAIFTVLVLFTAGATAQLGSEPELQEYRQPDISVNQEHNTVTATFYLENTGGGFGNIQDDAWLIEIQPKLQNRFSFTDALSTIGVSRPDTCDDSKPENVYKEFVFSIGEKKSISLTSPLNGEGSLEPGEYSLKALTVTGCATGDTAEEDVTQVDPYGWGTDVGTFTVEEDTEVVDPVDPVDPEDPSTVWISYSNSNDCIAVSSDQVSDSFESFSSEQACLDEQSTDGGPSVWFWVALASVGAVLLAGAGFVGSRVGDVFG